MIVQELKKINNIPPYIYGKYHKLFCTLQEQRTTKTTNNSSNNVIKNIYNKKDILNNKEIQIRNIKKNINSTPYNISKRNYTNPMDILNEHKNGGALKAYCIDLTELARNHKQDPVIGREDVLRRTIEILSRRRKNNPILIGDPGVGKTAIIEGLAQRIVLGEVPETVKNKRVLSLDFASLLAGAGVKGQFEQRLKSVIKEIEKSGDIILFVDEVHLLVSGNNRMDGSVDAANLLKPVLARGSILFCGATTLDEYRKNIEKDGALARRFQTVFVDEPTIDDTISILRGIKNKYELHHRVTILDNAVIASAKYAKRYFRDRKLPDKAIDLLDEAASRLCMQLESKPDSIDMLERSIIQRRIELEALCKETDEITLNRRKMIEKSVEDDQKKLDRLKRIWNDEKSKRVEYNRLKEELELSNISLQKSLQEGNYTKAGELQHVVIPSLEKKVLQQKLIMTKQPSAYSHNTINNIITQDDINDEEIKDAFRSVLLVETVTEEDIANVVERHTGIPVHKLLQKDKAKLLHMEEYLKKHIISQDIAINRISECVRVSRTGLQSPLRPYGVFMFLGPTGVGKTELAKSLAEFLFDDKNAIVRIDMSEYTEKFSSSRLIGAPPGYVGYEEGGILTEAIRQRPYQIVLFDEIEKAHREVCNLMLQIFDEGFLTDSQGHRVDFRNTIIIMTSNLGSREAFDNYLNTEQENYNNDSISKFQLMDTYMKSAVRQHFPPEFVNRIDEIITFSPLQMESLIPIIDIQLDDIKKLLYDREIDLKISLSAKKWLAEKTYDPFYGARPLKRAINTYILQPLSRALLHEMISNKSTIYIWAPGQITDINHNAYHKLLDNENLLKNPNYIAQLEFTLINHHQNQEDSSLNLDNNTVIDAEVIGEK